MENKRRETMKKLNRLSGEQEAMLPIMRERWLRMGLSTEPANREQAIAAARVAYARANMKAPQLVVWLNSPLAGAIGAHLLSHAQVGAQVWDQVGDQVRDQVGAGDDAGPHLVRAGETMTQDEQIRELQRQVAEADAARRYAQAESTTLFELMHQQQIEVA